MFNRFSNGVIAVVAMALYPLDQTIANEGYVSNSAVASQFRSGQAQEDYGVLWILTMGGYASPWLALEGRYGRSLWDSGNESIQSLAGVYARPIYPLGGAELYGVFGYTELRTGENDSISGLSTGAGIRIKPLVSQFDVKIEYFSAINRDGITARMAVLGAVARF